MTRTRMWGSYDIWDPLCRLNCSCFYILLVPMLFVRHGFQCTIIWSCVSCLSSSQQLMVQRNYTRTSCILSSLGIRSWGRFQMKW
ncbi:uncharacterized protein LOC111478520 isoform X1 [Cucurbita maxima]|uniref:Uncharacterized protein LOC111478520 isoform X1 n=1 Tax=Cucurbita maxima TaxID=3661 RepID=A0A6J1IN38_CUCMA|nr:uncharacterized protein LOC111478520 isoform X1 [Cucurbita maxima]